MLGSIDEGTAAATVVASLRAYLRAVANRPGQPTRTSVPRTIALVAAFMHFRNALPLDVALNHSIEILDAPKTVSKNSMSRAKSEGRALLSYLMQLYGDQLGTWSLSTSDNEFFAELDLLLTQLRIKDVLEVRAKTLRGGRGGRPRGGRQMPVLRGVEGLIRQARKGNTNASDELSLISKALRLEASRHL